MIKTGEIMSNAIPFRMAIEGIL